MATVTGYTAERMKQIEDKTVTDGEVQGDNLILTTRDGTPIDAGNVRGPQGNVGPMGEVSQAELDAVTGPSTQSGNDIVNGGDGKLFFDHDIQFRDHLPKFADTAQRNAAIPTPVKGQVSVVAGDIQRWDGTTWRSMIFTTTKIPSIPVSGAGYCNVSAAQVGLTNVVGCMVQNYIQTPTPDASAFIIPLAEATGASGITFRVVSLWNPYPNAAAQWGWVGSGNIGVYIWAWGT